MEKVVAYPAVLDDRENASGEYTVTFPDVPGVISDGNSLAEALTNGSVALGLVLYDQENLPQPSSLAVIQDSYPGTIVSYISADLAEAAKESYSPMVKKNTRIPSDIAERAENAGINFSATLTAALKQKLASINAN